MNGMRSTDLIMLFQKRIGYPRWGCGASFLLLDRPDALMRFDFLSRPPFMTIPFLNGGNHGEGALLVALLKSQSA
jgi:hypothetical protein